MGSRAKFGDRGMKSELRRLLSYSINYWPRLLLSILLMAFAGAAHGLIAALIRPIFDHVLQPILTP